MRLYSLVLFLNIFSIVLSAQNDKLQVLEDSLKQAEVLYSTKSEKYKSFSLKLGQAYIDYAKSIQDKSYAEKGAQKIFNAGALDSSQFNKPKALLEKEIQEEGIIALWIYYYKFRQFSLTSKHDEAQLQIGKQFLKSYCNAPQSKSNEILKETGSKILEEYYKELYNKEGIPESLYKEAYRLAPLYNRKKKVFYEALLWETQLKAQFKFRSSFNTKETGSSVIVYIIPHLDSVKYAKAFLKTQKALDIVGSRYRTTCDEWAPDFMKIQAYLFRPDDYNLRESYKAIATLSKSYSSLSDAEKDLGEALTAPLVSRLQQILFDKKYNLLFFAKRSSFDISMIKEHPKKIELVKDLVDLAKFAPKALDAMLEQSECLEWQAMNPQWDLSLTRISSMLALIRLNIDSLGLPPKSIAKIHQIASHILGIKHKDVDNIYDFHYQLEQDIKSLKDKKYTKSTRNLYELLTSYRSLIFENKKKLYKEKEYSPLVLEEELYTLVLDHFMRLPNYEKDGFFVKTVDYSIKNFKSIFYSNYFYDFFYKHQSFLPKELLVFQQIEKQLVQFYHDKNIKLTAQDYLQLLNEYNKNYRNIEMGYKLKLTSPRERLRYLTEITAKYLDQQINQVPDSLIVSICDNFINSYPNYKQYLFLNAPFYESSYVLWKKQKAKEKGRPYIHENPVFLAQKIRELSQKYNLGDSLFFKGLKELLPSIDYQLGVSEEKGVRQGRGITWSEHRQLVKLREAQIVKFLTVWEQIIVPIFDKAFNASEFFIEKKQLVSYLSVAFLAKELDNKQAGASNYLEEYLNSLHFTDHFKIKGYLDILELQGSKMDNSFFWIKRYLKNIDYNIVKAKNKEEYLKIEKQPEHQYFEREFLKSLGTEFSKEESQNILDSLAVASSRHFSKIKKENLNPFCSILGELFAQKHSFSSDQIIDFFDAVLLAKDNYNSTTISRLQIMQFEAAKKQLNSTEDIDNFKDRYLKFLNENPAEWPLFLSTIDYNENNIWTEEEIAIFFEERADKSLKVYFILDDLHTPMQELAKSVASTGSIMDYLPGYYDIDVLRLTQHYLDLGLWEQAIAPDPENRKYELNHNYIHWIDSDIMSRYLRMVYLLLYEGKVEPALEYAVKGIDGELFHPKVKIELLLQASRIYKKLADKDNSLNYLEDATKTAEELELSKSLVALDWAIYFSEDFQIKKANRFFKVAIDSADTKTKLIEAHYQAAFWNNYYNNNEVAEFHYLNVIKLIQKRIKFNYLKLNEEQREIFLKILEPKIHNYYRFVAEYPSPANRKALVNLHLLIKGLGLENSSNIQALILNSENVSLKEQFKKLQDLKQKVADASTLSVEKRKSKGISLLKLYLEIQEQKKIISSSSQELRDFFKQENKEVNFKNICSNLAAEETAIEFAIISKEDKYDGYKDYYYAILMQPQEASPLLIELCELEDLHELLAINIQANTINYISDPLESNYLYQLVFEPLEPYLANTKKLHISPTGGMAKIAFSTLLVSDYGNARLMDKYSIYNYVSFRSLNKKVVNPKPQKSKILLVGGVKFTFDKQDLEKVANNRNIKVNSDVLKATQKERPSQGLLTMAKSRGEDFNPLPGTLSEISKISPIFEDKNWNCKRLVDVNALEENLIQEIKQSPPNILHIATHGFFFPKKDSTQKQKTRNTQSVENRISEIKDPLLRSGLALAGINQVWRGGTNIEGLEDGILTALEVSNLNLTQTELVVLSACETARGDISTNEGVMGLQRAFKMAGAKQLIISLWKVPDLQTSELMQLFYRYYLSGETTYDAFVKAQQDMRKRYRNPYYWAAFILVE